MKAEERVFTVQFSKSLSQFVGKPTYSFIAEGFEREFQVVPQAELQRVQGLLKWTVCHSVLMGSMSKAKGAEILGISLVDFDVEKMWETLKNDQLPRS